MPQIPQILLSARTLTTARANLRQGNATTAAPVLRKVEAGTPVTIHAIVAGLAVEGNPFWFLTDENAYIWAGACGPLTMAGAPTPVPSPAPAPTPTPAPPLNAATLPAVPIVVDLYNGDKVTDFALAYAAGLRGVIHKATTGQTGWDKTYADRRIQAKAAGLLWGAYHWGTSAPVDKQIDNFLKRADPDDETLMALDYEIDASNQMSLDQCREFLQKIEVKLGRKAVLYSGHLIKDKLGTKVDPFFGAHRLWLAEYNPTPTVQKSWSSFWLWQYAEKKSTVPGIPGNSIGAVDFDHFAGTEAQLKADWAS